MTTITAFDRPAIFRSAWKIARDAAARTGEAVRAFIGNSLRMAWGRARADRVAAATQALSQATPVQQQQANAAVPASVRTEAQKRLNTALEDLRNARTRQAALKSNSQHYIPEAIEAIDALIEHQSDEVRLAQEEYSRSVSGCRLYRCDGFAPVYAATVKEAALDLLRLFAISTFGEKGEVAASTLVVRPEGHRAVVSAYIGVPDGDARLAELELTELPRA